MIWCSPVRGQNAAEDVSAEPGPDPEQDAPGRGTDDADCLWCHGKASIVDLSPEALLAMVRQPVGEPVPREAAKVQDLYVPEGRLRASAHARVRCVECHQGATRQPHDRFLPPAACTPCHDPVIARLSQSSHGPAATGASGAAPVGCRDCHKSLHDISPHQHPRTHARALREAIACQGCHDDRSDDRNDPQAVSPWQSYARNVHGEALIKFGLPFSATCSDCHGAHDVLPPTDPESRLHPGRVPQTCGACHEGIEGIFEQSVHGKQLIGGNGEAATCTACHHSHGIGEVDESFLRAVIEECSDCHIELGRTYAVSYHGKATALGSAATAMCSSCHGHHDIRAVEHPLSRVNAANLRQTCGECHHDVNDNFVQFQAHVDYTDRERFPAVFYTWLIMTSLLLSVLAVFVPHSILWTIRELVERVKRPFRHAAVKKGERYIERFRPVHRYTHFLIVISFMGLVTTGFPLKYSYTDWAKTLSGFLGGAQTMGLLHRIFAILTFVYGGIHLVYLVHFFARKCPRPRWRFLFGPDSMVFSPRDLKDLWGMVKWFFFLGPKPRFDRWTYLEKFDYFGEAWGIFVIGGSGLILWFPEFFTRWLPGWILNCAMVVHSIEALLAASVIFLVHFLNTHLRPDKFPVDMVMFTGSMSESEMKEERPREYERLVESGELEKRVVERTSWRWRLVGRIAGIFAFLAGLALIALALVSEYRYLFGK